MIFNFFLYKVRFVFHLHVWMLVDVILISTKRYVKENEQRHEKTNVLHMRKQRSRSASR